MNHERSSVVTCNHPVRAAMSTPDLTTRGSRDDAGLWQFDENRIRRVMKKYCMKTDTMNGGRSYRNDPDEPIELDEWYSLLEDNRKRSLAQVETTAGMT